jgi:CRP-like cAMP-binding protein
LRKGGTIIDESVVEQLAAIDLFRGLSVEDVRSLMSHATTFTVAEDQPVFEAGAEERVLYFLIEGAIEIDLSVPFVEEAVLDQLQPISIFGESSFFHPQPHPVTARALAESTVIRLERDAYDRLLESNVLAAARMGANAAEILAAKLQHTDAWIVDLLQAEQSHRAQKKWWDFRQSMGHAFDKPEGGGFTTGAGWR